MDLARQIVEAGLRLIEAGVTDGVTGNISARLRNEEMILITPTSRDFRLMEERDLVRIKIGSFTTEGRWKPSSEWRLHVAVYQVRPDVNAIIHHHATWASAVAVAGKTIPVLIDEAADIGEIPTAPYGPSASEALAERASREFGSGHNAILLANHGAVAVGKDLGEALRRALEVERLAKIYIGAHLLGGVHALDGTSIARSREFFEGYRRDPDEAFRPFLSAVSSSHKINLRDLIAFSFQTSIVFMSLLQSFILRRPHTFEGSPAGFARHGQA